MVKRLISLLVCDGVHEWQEECFVEGDHFLNGYTYFHHNWGAETSSNGWFAFSVFQPKYSDYNFASNMKLVYNIGN